MSECSQYLKLMSGRTTSFLHRTRLWSIWESSIPCQDSEHWYHVHGGHQWEWDHPWVTPPGYWDPQPTLGEQYPQDIVLLFWPALHLLLYPTLNIIRNTQHLTLAVCFKTQGPKQWALHWWVLPYQKHNPINHCWISHIVTHVFKSPILQEHVIFRGKK
jgi:hypothetical protein